MYHGEVNVAQDSLNSFLKSAESLKVRGLTDDENSDHNHKEESGNSISNNKITSPPKKETKLQPSTLSKPTYQEPAEIVTVNSSRSDPVKQEVIELSEDTEQEHETYHDDHVTLPPHSVLPSHNEMDDVREDPMEMVPEGGQGMIILLQSVKNHS